MEAIYYSDENEEIITLEFVDCLEECGIVIRTSTGELFSNNEKKELKRLMDNDYQLIGYL